MKLIKKCLGGSALTTDWNSTTQAKLREGAAELTRRVMSNVNKIAQNAAHRTAIEQKKKMSEYPSILKKTKDSEIIALQDALYHGGFANGTSYDKFVDGLRKGNNIGKNTQAALDRAVAAGYDEAALRKGKLIKRKAPAQQKVLPTTNDNLDMAKYLYGKSNVYSVSNAATIVRPLLKSIVNKIYGPDTFTGEHTVDSDNAKRQAYALYLTGKGITDAGYAAVGDDGISEGTIDRAKHPMRYTFNNADTLVDDQGNIIVTDDYDYHTDYDKINKDRVARGKKPYKMTASRKLETWLSQGKGSGSFKTRMIITKEDQNRYAREYRDRNNNFSQDAKTAFQGNI